MAGSSTDDLTTSHGCLVRAKWGWTISEATGRWSKQQQAIKPRRVSISTSGTDPFNDGFSVLYSKLKIRGKGRALVLRYESEDGKDFHLYGWELPITTTTTP